MLTFLLLGLSTKDISSDPAITIMTDGCEFFDTKGDIISKFGMVRTLYFEDHTVVTCASYIENVEKMSLEYTFNKNPETVPTQCVHKSWATSEWSEFINPNGNMILQCVFSGHSLGNQQ